MKYENKFFEHNYLYQAYESLSYAPCNWLDWILHPINCAAYDNSYWKHKKKAEAWKKGLDWFSSIDDKFKVGVGALTYSISEELWCLCEYCEVEDFYTFCDQTEVQIQNENECVDSEYEQCNTFKKIIITPIEHESDGIALAESCIAIPNPTYPAVRVEGASHMQIRNSIQTKETLYNLYEGDYGDFFLTSKRD